MDNAEEQYEEYRRRYEEIQERLSDPEISDKVDKLVKKIAKIVGCDLKHLELNFMASPHMDDYETVKDSEDYEIPNTPTMNLGRLLEHLSSEEDDNLEIYFDPIYLKSGVNEILDVLTTTIDNKMIIVPIGNYKKKTNE